MKKALFSILCAALLASCTNTPGEFSNPQSYADNTCDWQKELRVTHVEFTDTATILTFFYQSHQPFYTLSIGPQTYLSDEKDRHYKVLFMKEHKLGEYFPSGPDGTSFHVGFEPLPKGTKVFDIIESVGSNFFKIIGIHDSTYTPAKPKFSRKELLEADEIRHNIFKSGAVTLRGTVAGYDRNSGFQTYKMLYSVYDNRDNATVSLDIDPSGHFEYSFDVNNMIGAAIIDQNNSWHTFIVQPGDTLDIIFYKDGTDNYSLSDGRPYLLRNYMRIPSGVYPTDKSRFQMGDSVDLLGIQSYAYECKAKAKDYLDYLAAKYRLTAFEYQFADIMLENDIMEGFLDYRMDVKDQAVMYHRSDNVQADAREIVRLLRQGDSITRDPAGYRFLADFPANDSLLMVMPYEWVIFNRYKYDGAFYNSDIDLDSLEGVMDDASIFALQTFLEDSTHLANDMKIFGADEPSLFGKLCMMQNIEYQLETLNTYYLYCGVANTDSALMDYVSKVKGLINDPVLGARVDIAYNEFKRKQAPYWELPECRGKEVLKKILANYPGKYVYIDFWSTGCGPCVADIKSTVQNRHEIMTKKYDSFAMIFITSDPEQYYESFRQEWLEGAESYRVSQDDYNALAGLFNFSAIPHHEMITPDGRAVTKVPEMFGVNPDNPDPNQK